jgi:hypothetical protein
MIHAMHIELTVTLSPPSLTLRGLCFARQRVLVLLIMVAYWAIVEQCGKIYGKSLPD